MLRRSLTSLTPLQVALHRRALGHVPSVIEMRKAMEEHVAAQAKNSTLPEFDPDHVGHPPAASHSTCLIPLASDPEAQLRYRNASGHARARFGVLLEDLDMFAVWIAFRHNQALGTPMGKPTHHPMSIVTACVDKIEMQNATLRSDLDIVMDGFVSWVGRSSIEATMTLKQNYGDNDFRDLMTARFVMVSQDPKTRKTVRNVPLLVETREDKERFEQGEKAKNLRIAREKNSLLRTVPTEEERNTLHQLFLKTINEKSHTFQRYLPPHHVWMQDAKLKNNIICFPSKRNLYGKIFGGYLMRAAFETAWANAAAFSKSRPRVTEVDSIMFRKPVEVGSLLLLSSQVCYSTTDFMQVSVDAAVLDLETGNSELTNTFQFTFESENGKGRVPIVLPKTYEDGILYLNGRRHVEGGI